MNSGPLSQRISFGSSTSLLDDPLEHADGVVGAHPPRGRCGERFAGVLVGDGQDLERAAVSGLVGDEVDRPHLVGAGSDQVAGHPRPAPAPPGLRRQPQPLVTPQPLHPLAVARPALPSQQRMDAPVAVARMTPREQLQPLPQQRLLRHQPAPVALRGAMLARQPARPALGDPETIAQRHHRSAPPLRAQKFPRATSLSMSISSACSPTIRFNRAFSFSSAFSRTTSSGRIARYWLRQRW